MYLVLRNNVTKRRIEIPDLEDDKTSELFYHFTIQLPEDVIEGEYDYVLFSEDDEEIVTGLLQVGDYHSNTQSYDDNNPNDEYITYEG